MRSVATLERDQPYVFSVAWSADGATLLSGSVGEVRLLEYDVEEPHVAEVARYTEQPARVFADMSPDARFAVSASTDVRLLEVGTESHVLTGAAVDGGRVAEVYAVSWSPVADEVLTAGEDGSVRLFLVDRAAGTLTPGAVASDHIGKAFGVAWSPDGTHAVSVGEDRTLRVLRVEHSVLTEVAREMLTEWVTAVTWAKDRPIVVGTWGESNTVQAFWFEPVTGALVFASEFSPHATGLQTLAWSRDGRYLLTGGHDDTVTLLEYAEGEFLELGSFENGTAGVHAVAWAPDGSHAALAASHVDALYVLDVSGCAEHDL